MTQAQRCFQELKKSGKNAVILEGKWGSSGSSFVAEVDRRVHVPAGEKGLVFIRDFLRKNRRHSVQRRQEFTRGFVGFLSYELGAKWQGIHVSRGETSSFAMAKIPDALFIYVDKVHAFKSVHHKWCLPIIKRGMPGHTNMQQNLQDAICESVHVNTHLQHNPENASGAASALEPNLSKKEYLQKIRTIKEYLFAGETYQVNFSQKFEAPFTGEAFNLYQKLSAINPSPHQFFMETSEFAVVSNSPERLFSLTPRQAQGDMIIQTQPIKGTIARGRSAAEDFRNIKKLLASEKDKAELAMIVDLERNDLGKICTPGTVQVVESRGIEKYSHVIHTVATIEGALVKDCDFLDALHALFPGGSITGCPKKRTMEIIEKLEGEPRGIYCGSAGFIDISGACDFNIMIRTAFIDKIRKKPIISFYAGGGIVADSDPHREYDEVQRKSTAIKNAL